MKKLLLFPIITVALSAKSNTIKTDTNGSKDINSGKISTIKKLKLEENLAKAIAKEKKIKEEQKFYQGEEYNLTDHKIDPGSLDNIKAIEPDYDYEMLEF